MNHLHHHQSTTQNSINLDVISKINKKAHTPFRCVTGKRVLRKPPDPLSSGGSGILLRELGASRTQEPCSINVYWCSNSFDQGLGLATGGRISWFISMDGWHLWLPNWEGGLLPSLGTTRDIHVDILSSTIARSGQASQFNSLEDKRK
jgi:hypothetical protein